MLYPFTRAWTARQKWLIVGSVVAALTLCGVCIYAYEQHLRSTIRETLIDHQWSMQGCMDCSTDITFPRDYTIEVEEDGVGGPYRGTGTWRLHGRDYLELEYEMRMVRSVSLNPWREHYRWHIDKLSRDEIIFADLRHWPEGVLFTRSK
jgi:hypothetical protein